MNVVYTKSEYDKLVKGKQKPGLVPTMGALHTGHFSLIERAISENENVVVSIFVNPTQFNDKNDLKNYPRNTGKDLATLAYLLRPNDIVFLPDEKEMYPEPDKRIFDFGHLNNVMEGKHRSGHFNGVGQIVSKLFETINPAKAYFGEKDLQQLAVIRKLVSIIKSPVEIIGCPIVREPDGLAMSSRNQLLNSNERNEAAKIYKAMSKVPLLSSKISVEEVKQKTIDAINQSPSLSIEYLEIVNGDNLLPISSWEATSPIYGCVAVRAGKVRLIDNIRIKK